MDKGKSDDSPADRKALDPRQRREMIDDLQNLSGMLDEETDAAPTFDDLPVLKSFVDPATLGRGRPFNIARNAAPPSAAAETSADPRRRFDPTLGGTPVAASGTVRPTMQAARQRASEIVDELLAQALPRLEAELRAKLEAEVERMLRPPR